MKKLRVIFFWVVVFSLIFSQLSLANISSKINDENHLVELTKAYGFYMGQEYTCNTILKKYPGLEPKLITYQNEFKIKFSPSFNKIEQKLSIYIDIKNYKNMLNEELQKRYNTDITKDNALNFIDVLKKRKNGDLIPEDILKTFLIYKPLYIKNPHKEILDGYTQLYNTEGKNKAQGIKLTLKLPISWKKKKGDHPHIVNKFVSENGNGQEMCLVQIRKNEEIKKLSSQLKLLKENNINFSQKEINEILLSWMPDEGNFIQGELIELDGIPTFKIRYEMDKIKMDFNFKIETLMFYSFYEDYSIIIQFATSSSDKLAEKLNAPEYKNENSKELFNKNTLLFKTIANSMVLQNQWE